MPPKKSIDAEVAVASPKKGAVPAKASKSQHADPVAAPAAAASAAASPVEAPAAGPLNRASERIVGLLAAIKPATVADAATAAQLARLQELRKAHTVARDTLRVMLDEQDAKRPAGGPNAVDPARRKQLLELDAQFAALRADNDAAHRLKTQIVLDQQRLQQGADRTTTLRLTADRMQTTARDARRAADAAAVDAVALKKKRAAVVASGAATAAAAGRSATQIDAEIDTLTKKCDAAKAKSDHAIERQLDKELAVLRKIKKAFAADATEDERVAAAERHAAKLASAADQAEAAIAKAIDERDTHVRDLEQLRADKNVNAAFDAVRRKLADIAAKMDANRTARRDATNAPLSAAAEAERAEGRALTDRVSKARKDKEDMERQMDEIRASIPTAAVPFAADLRADVIGRSGAGVAQLQRDYGVAIEFDGDKALLVGGAADVEKAAASFKAHCAALLNARQRIEVTFAPDQAPGIIGTGGSKISAIQRSSGANIKVDSAAGKAVLIGTAEAIADAKRQIEEHLAQNCESAVPFPAGLRDIILGKGGETVRQLEKEPGIRRIRVDKDNCVVYAVGTVEAVTKVKEFYTQIVRDWGHAPVDVTIPDVMVPTVLGPRGQTISAIQTETGAILTLRRPDALASNREGQVTVKGRGGSAAAAAASMSPGSAPNPSGARNAPSILQIRGPVAAVEAAKRRVEELIKRDEVKVKVEPELFSFLSTAGPTIVDSASTSSLPATPGSAPQPSESPITDAALATPTNKKLLTPLEQLRAAYGVDQVSLIRFERCVVICGKKDKVTAARMALERLLLRSGVTAVTVPFPPVMRFALLQKKRTAAGKSVLQDVRDAVIAEVAANTSPVAAAAAAAASPGQSPATSTLTVEVGPRGTHELVVSGTNKAEVDAATTKVRALVAEWTATKIKTVPIEGGSAVIPAVLGRQGSNTTALQEKYNAEINIDRDKCTVSVFALDAKNLEACVAEIVAIPGVVKAAPVEILPTEAAN